MIDQGTPRRGRDEGGFILPTFALVLIVLIAMAGFGIDVWNWWYTGQQAQRAADAAALSGVVFLPDDLGNATSTATASATSNGFASGVTVTSGSRPNQLKVEVTREVDNKFTSLLGVSKTTVTRDAVAEYTGRVSMGSPSNTLAQDPDRNIVVDFWLSDSGRGTTKQGGDRYQSAVCSGQPVFRCPAGNPEPQNPEYDQNGYSFTVRVNAASVSGPLSIEVYDPAQIPNEHQDCGEAAGGAGDAKVPRGFSMALVNGDWPPIAGVANNDRYDDPRNAPSKKFCAGDVENFNENAADLAALTPGAGFNPQNAVNQTSTFVLRAPDATPASDLDNPIITAATCRPKQFAPWASPAGRSWYNYLDVNDGWRDNNGVPSATNNRGNRRTVQNGQYVSLPEADAFHNEYRTWVSICTLDVATVNGLLAAGGSDFIVQVLSNVPYQASGVLADPLPRGDVKRGRNHFSLRASAGTTDLDTFANGRLPMAAAAQGAATTFYLAQVGPEHAGRTLSVEFFDVGDAAATGSITIRKGVGSGGGSFTCSFSRIDLNNNNSPPTYSGCQLQNVNASSGYQGSKTTALVAIPDDYTCSSADLSCWATVLFAYPASGGAVFDHTVWSAGIVGDPVRLVE